jgi:hypothetical protein
MNTVNETSQRIQTHATFVIERTFPVAPQRVWYALSANTARDHATVLTERGDWSEAEAELITEGERLATRPTQAAEALARLGELRRMQGRLGEAAELLHRVEFHPRAQLAHARCHWRAETLRKRSAGSSGSCAGCQHPTGLSGRLGLSSSHGRARLLAMSTARG